MKKKFLALALFPLISTSCGDNASYPFMLGLGGPDVPVGQYSTKILQYFGVDEAALYDAGLISYGKDVKEVTTHVKEGMVHAGFIYKTDAVSANLKIVEAATTEMTGGDVIYPAAVLKRTTVASAAQAFLSYMHSTSASARYEAVGFKSLAKIPDSEVTPAPSGSFTIKVAAAASMTESLSAVVEDYKAVAPNITVDCYFGSSGTLLKQIQEGYDYDIFLSAGQKQMNTCETEERLLENTRFNMLQNEVVLSVPDNNPSSFKNIEGLMYYLKYRLSIL